jgi:hypothetical protein
VYLPIRHVCSIVAVGSKADECSQTAPKGRIRRSVLQDLVSRIAGAMRPRGRQPALFSRTCRPRSREAMLRIQTKLSTPPASAPLNEASFTDGSQPRAKHFGGLRLAMSESAWVNSWNSFACCSAVKPMPVSEI